MDAAALATQIKELREIVDSLQQARKKDQEEKERLIQENRLLRQKLQLFINRYFGGKQNEAINRAQLELLLSGLETNPSQGEQTRAAGSVPRPGRKKATRQPLPNHLAVEEVILIC
jgi:hypothetical protein